MTFRCAEPGAKRSDLFIATNVDKRSRKGCELDEENEQYVGPISALESSLAMD
jgi:hypothetical protein